MHDCPDEPDPSTDNRLLLAETPETSSDDLGEDSDIQGGVPLQSATSRHPPRQPDGFELGSSSFGGEGDVTVL